MIALGSGDLDEAERWLHRSLGLYEELGLVFAIVRVRRDLGYLALRRSEWALARAWLVGSLHPNSIPGFANIVAHAYVGLALVATKQAIGTMPGSCSTPRSNCGSVTLCATSQRTRRCGRG